MQGEKGTTKVKPWIIKTGFIIWQREICHSRSLKANSSILTEEKVLSKKTGLWFWFIWECKVSHLFYFLRKKNKVYIFKSGKKMKNIARVIENVKRFYQFTSELVGAEDQSGLRSGFTLENPHLQSVSTYSRLFKQIFRIGSKAQLLFKSLWNY